MAKTPCSHCRGLGSIPGQGNRSYTTTRSSNAATKDPACHEEEQRCRVPQPSPDAAKQRNKQEKKGAKLANNEITLTNSPKSFSCFDIVLWLHKMLLLGERDEGRRRREMKLHSKILCYSYTLSEFILQGFYLPC